MLKLSVDAVVKKGICILRGVYRLLFVMFKEGNDEKFVLAP